MQKEYNEHLETSLRTLANISNNLYSARFDTIYFLFSQEWTHLPQSLY